MRFGREFDFSSNELGQAAKLLLGGNGNMLERLLGPLTVVVTDTGRELVELARQSLSKRLYKHYRGFLRGMMREYEVEARGGVRKAKRLLYAYRVALTGVHALRAGEIVPDVGPLAKEYGFGRVEELIEVKRRAEYAGLSEDEARAYEGDFAELEGALAAALEASGLPEGPRNAGEIDRFVVATRLGAM